MNNESGIFHVAIDGPAASGKGTVAHLLSKILGIAAFDTGAVYRAIAVAVMRAMPQEHIKGATRDEILKILSYSRVNAAIINGATHVYIDGDDVTGQIRKNEVSQTSSYLATMPDVRKLCTKILQSVAVSQSLIVEGRDISSVILPNAKYKFYLTANVNVRATRRYKELLERGDGHIEYAQVLAETRHRDKQDATKGGLVKTADAIVVDSTKMTVDQVARHMLDCISL
jgi:cytidylate kinase